MSDSNSKDSNKKYKWLIKRGPVQSDRQKEEYWGKAHADDDYDNVFSLTEDEEFRTKIITELEKQPSHEQILIPGCGSRGFLERAIVRRLSGVKSVLCTDFQKVIEVAAARTKNKKITYAAKDSKALGLENEIDAVVVVNSILSDSDQENREIISSCLKALKPGGVFVGFFPTINCALEISNISKDHAGFEHVIDSETCRFFDPVQNVDQTFYTPIRLRQIFNEAGFELDRVELCYLDSEFFKAQAASMYGMDDPDLVIYEHMLVAHKP